MSGNLRNRTAWGTPDLLFALLLAVAFLAAVRATHDLDWPCEEDFWRDMASARAILEGRYGEDPAYAGEHVWYNPLVPGIVALISKCIGLPLRLIYARGGAYINLFVPIAFYGLVRRLFDPDTALVAVFGFLFLGDPRLVSWVSNATYSPWMWPENFAQGLLYLSLILFFRARESQRPRSFAATGLVLGVTMLAHVMPAFLGAVVMSAVLLVDATKRRVALLHWMILGGMALLATLPFTLLIGRYYGFRVLNAEGLSYVHPMLTLAALPQLLRHQLTLRAGLAVVGLVQLARMYRRSRSAVGLALLTWCLLCAALLAHSDWAQIYGKRQLLPGWHYLFYLKALESIAFGLGTITLLRAVSRRLTIAGRDTREAIAPTILLLAALLAVLPRHVRSVDLADNHKSAIQYTRQADRPQLATWIEQHTAPGDVFLSSFDYGFFSVLAAGRKVVWTAGIFANPYVDPRPRQAAQEAMFAALAASDGQRFLHLAAQFRVRWVIVPPAGRRDDSDAPLPTTNTKPTTTIDPARWPFLELVAVLKPPPPPPPLPWPCSDTLSGGCDDPPIDPVMVFRVLPLAAQRAPAVDSPAG